MIIPDTNLIQQFFFFSDSPSLSRSPRLLWISVASWSTSLLVSLPLPMLHATDFWDLALPRRDCLDFFDNVDPKRVCLLDWESWSSSIPVVVSDDILLISIRQVRLWIYLKCLLWMTKYYCRSKTGKLR